MEWWQTLIVATVPALITALALVVQQRWSVNTELKRLEQLDKDRQHARDMASDERAAAAAAVSAEHTRSLQALWRDDRRRAHEHLIAELGRFTPLLFSVMASVLARGDGVLEADIAQDALDEAAFERAHKHVLNAFPAVLLIASNEARDAVNRLSEAESSAAFPLLFPSFDDGGVREMVDGTFRGNNLTLAFLEAREHYIATARRDLGATE